jgi:hypothetical protein
MLDMYEAMTEEELELAEEEEGALMQMQLLQTVQLQQRSSNAAGSEQDITSQDQHVAATNVVAGIEVKRADAKAPQEDDHHKHVATVVAGDTGEIKRPSPVTGEHKGVSVVVEAAAKNTAEIPQPSHGKAIFHLKGRVEQELLPLRLLYGAVIGVFLLAIVVQFLVYTGSVPHLPKRMQWINFMSFVSKKGTAREFVQQLNTLSAVDVESNMPPASSDEKFLQPLASSGPVRLEVKIEGAFDRSTIQSPLTQRTCVMYSATAKCHGESKVVAEASKQSQFIASMADAPWVKILVASRDITCFDMCGGQWSHSEKLADAAAELKAFVADNMKTERPAQERDAKEFDFEETSLLVGSVVTLVGKLCRGPGGELVLQRWEEHAGKAKKKKSAWFGKILASDDSSLHGSVLPGGMPRSYGTI